MPPMAAAFGFFSLAQFLENAPLVPPGGTCTGSLINDTIVPGMGDGTCRLYLDSTKYSTIMTCNGTGIVEQIYNNPTCKGPLVEEIYIPNGYCMKGNRGVSTIFECVSLSDVRTRSYTLAPPPPKGTISCVQGNGSLTVALEDVNASVIDMVSFSAGFPGRKPFIDFTVPVKGGRVSAQIPAMQLSMKTRKYQVQARVKARNQSEGNPDAWSKLNTAVSCTLASVDTHQDNMVFKPSLKPATKWMAIYRAAGGADLPDYLDQHNAGDALGYFSFGAWFASKKPGTVPITRYCVEYLDVTLDNVTTGSTSGKAQKTPFGDFKSCNQGNCVCMLAVDRGIARQPRSLITDQCRTKHPTDLYRSECHDCGELSDKRGNQYPGRTVIPLPVVSDKRLWNTTGGFPDGYPSPFEESPMGYWFSFPEGGKCPFGTSVGDAGCTWQRSPLAHTIYTDDLVPMGWNSSHHESGPMTKYGPAKVWVDEAVSRSNWKIGMETFSRLNVPPCGTRLPAVEPELII